MSYQFVAFTKNDFNLLLKYQILYHPGKYLSYNEDCVFDCSTEIYMSQSSFPPIVTLYLYIFVQSTCPKEAYSVSCAMSMLSWTYQRL
jgi:hypothetical protein